VAIRPAAISRITITVPEEPPDEPPSPELTGVTEVVFVFLSLPLRLEWDFLSSAGEDDVVDAEVVPVTTLLDPPLLEDCFPEEGTLGRYSWPDGVPAAAVAAPVARATQSAVIVIRRVIEAMGGEDTEFVGNGPGPTCT
jgi:hypothetical protein